jgi:hypothetical protein
MRNLLVQLVILQRNSQPVAVAEVPVSTKNETVTDTSALLVIEAKKNKLDNDLDSCFSLLLSCLPKTNSVVSDKDVSKLNH